MSILGADFDDAVARLKKAASDFTATYNQFVTIPPQYRPAAWYDVKQVADTTRNTIQTFISAADSAYQWIASSFGMNGLGIVIPLAPFLTVAGIGGAISAILLARGKMVDIIADAENRRRITELNVSRAEQGLQPLNPDLLYPTQPTILGDFATTAKWIVIGGAAILLLPKILEGMKK